MTPPVTKDLEISMNDFLRLQEDGELSIPFNGRKYYVIDAENMVDSIKKTNEENLKLKLSNGALRNRFDQESLRAREASNGLAAEVQRRIALERELQEIRNQIPQNQANMREEGRFVTWLRDYELLIDSALTMAAFGFSIGFPAAAVPIMLANGAIITFIRFLVTR